MTLTPELLLGPLGLTIFLAFAVGFFARDHQRADRDMRIDRDYWRDIAMTGVEVADKSTTLAVRKRDVPG